MRVAENRKPVRAHGHRRRRALDAGLHRLIWETENEVEVDAAYSVLAQIFDGSGRLRLTLDPVDRFLNNGIEALHAEARAVHAGCS